tara:strand:+ start:387 stop:494 length:108 start_codon:yes stop_codon:yes gene_type:complete
MKVKRPIDKNTTNKLEKEVFKNKISDIMLILSRKK